MPERALDLAVIIGSTREGRLGDTVARWFVRVAGQRPDFAIDLIDLAEAGLPTVHGSRSTPEPGRPGSGADRCRRRLRRGDAGIQPTAIQPR